MRIPDHIIEDIRNITDITTLVGSYVKLKRKGSNFFGLCPFHSEKTPSFSVNPAKQIFHCFGCNRGGNVFTFIMEYEKINFIEAVRMLAEKSGIKIPEAPSKEGESRTAQLYKANRAAAAEYNKYLMSDDGSEARKYLDGRGISKEVIKNFGIGLAPDEWDWLRTRLAEKGFIPPLLESAGLISSKQGGGYYDKFKGRIIFPILSDAGKVVAFGGRIWREDDDKLAKYINSPETPVYKKGRVLFGLFQTKEDVKKANEIVLVEGYTDFISVYMSGVNNVTATSGTALTKNQALLAKRYADSAILLYDGDDAGRKAAARAAVVILGVGMDVQIARLPADSDPDSFARKKGEDGLKSLILEAVGFVDFSMEQMESEISGSPAEKARAIRGIVQELGDIDDDLVREFLIRGFADRLRVDESVLLRELHRLRYSPVTSREERGTEEVRFRDAVEKAEYQVTMLLLSPEDSVWKRVSSYLKGHKFSHKEVEMVANTVLGEGTHPDESMLYNKIETASARFVLSKMIQEIEGVTDGLKLAEESIQTVEKAHVDAEISGVREQLKLAEQKGEDIVTLLEKQRDLVSRRDEMLSSSGRNQ